MPGFRPRWPGMDSLVFPPHPQPASAAGVYRAAGGAGAVFFAFRWVFGIRRITQARCRRIIYILRALLLLSGITGHPGRLPSPRLPPAR